MNKTLTKSLLLSLIRFPEIQLQTRDAHKLRGFFGNYFKEHSPLLHNHYDDGSLRYKYPLVQYKVIDNIPMLIGFNEGARMLTELFLEMKELKIADPSVLPSLPAHPFSATPDLEAEIKGRLWSSKPTSCAASLLFNYPYL